MNIEIRHQISYTQEEIYIFTINDSLEYRGIYLSNRNNIDDIFGYDWDDFYQNIRKEEFSNLYKKHDIDEYYNPGDNLCFDKDMNKLYKKYNPVMNKTIHGKTYLYGSYSNFVKKEHPLKITKEQIIEAIIEKVKGLEIR